ncbi:MAG: alpha/beta fold hydrolase [Wenzhouxiangellaceae bacterium]|nr:alpha/beta fold hydrolase [Wenzhouxiangellaceae bacterium]
MDLPTGVDPALYPFARAFHELPGGHRMHHIDHGQGEGPPVVMVHGNPTWSFYYRELVRGLCDRRRCLVPDHIGMGLSSRPGDGDYDYTLASRVADLGDFLDATVPEGPIDLVVHDWGGAIGMAWAATHPERIRRLVVLNTWAFTIPAEIELPRALAFARTRLGAALVMGFNAFSGLAIRMASARKLPAAVARGLIAPYRGRPANRLATLRFVQDIPLSPADPAWAVLEATENNLHRLADKPMLLGWGAQDFVFDDRVLARWRELFPNAELDYIESAGHYVLEDAHERLVPRIREFLFSDE